jgi:hypothetical protein
MVLPALYAKFGKFLFPKQTPPVSDNGRAVEAVFEK